MHIVSIYIERERGSLIHGGSFLGGWGCVVLGGRDFHCIMLYHISLCYSILRLMSMHLLRAFVVVSCRSPIKKHVVLNWALFRNPILLGFRTVPTFLYEM